MPSASGYQQVPTSDDIDASTSSMASQDSPSSSALAQQQQQRREQQVRATSSGRQFNPPPPAPYKRALLLAFIAFMFWLSLRLGALGGEQGTLSGIAGALERRGWMGPAQANGRAGELGTPPIKGQTAADIAAKLKEKYGAEVVHAKRYSNEHKYRPAASPIIKEKLKNGKVRLRGANPGGTF